MHTNIQNVKFNSTEYKYQPHESKQKCEKDMDL